MFPLHSFLFCLYTSFVFCSASVTIYHVPGQEPLGTGTTDPAAAAATYTGAAAYNPTRLNPPPIPSPLPAMAFSIPLLASGTSGLSKPQEAGFVGFSVEMSVVNQVFGKNSSLIQVPFLNLMATLQQRAGRVNLRVGGNTQEIAALVDSLPDGRILAKGEGVSNPTHTPALLYTLDLLYLMRNISDHVNARWFLGAPFNDTSNLRMQIIEHGEAILGDFLLGLQVGNEPDLYPGRLRPEDYTQNNYFGEFGDFIEAINNNPAITNKTNLMGPSISGNGHFTEQSVWDTGFVDAYSANLAYLTVEHYPDNNCAALFPEPNNPVKDPQVEFPTYLTHKSGKSIVQEFPGSPNFALSKGKPYIMMETNTASCGGFAGISDSFGAALWGIDYSMQLAYSNYSGAMMHVGGQQAFYNPFTPPPTNQSSFHSWTVGPIYYSALIMAEAMGPTNSSQILDLNANSQSEFTPAYAIYENQAPVRVALFNYITDPTGGSTYTASISIGGGTTGQPNATPAQVKVKYLSATSVSDKYNYTWAGQSFGNIFESDGRLKGNEDIQTVACDTNANVCNIKVPAPGFALVFLSDSAFAETGASPTTFPTTIHTKTLNTATIDASVLATSNGHNGLSREQDGSTSRGSAKNSAGRTAGACGFGAIVLLVVIVTVVS